ncbi:ATPase [Leucobacter sp. UCD-THU]|jgi:DNA helicase HerA-like ATPase|uniref:helicase HerA-like domain-containing protein n=1 Tax=Leucobacter sp. UCD-THU TaxID=1292023 RepID=UPI00037B6D24|nr:helicase HerA-like domain-containing protein [Leucobacter sp. UCD-THU]EYT54133.1 ATPase [Leucobacter sp. UCD-THU]
MGEPLTEEQIETVRAGYPAAADGGPTMLELGALVNGEPRADVQITIPLGMLNRHGLIAGATGTGKTRTLQVLAEQVAAHGVPVFAADIKGDLSGVAVAGEPNEKLLARTEGIGQAWQPRASQTEFFTLGGMGIGVPIRTTIEKFGPVMLSKVLGLNPTQESSLGLIFYYAREEGLPLVGLDDLQALLAYLTSDDGKAEIARIGGLSKQTVGVIQRSVIAFAAEGADVFFGEPAFDPADLLRTIVDGDGIERGVVNLLEVPGVQDRPVLFSTFLMFLLSELFETLPEVGDRDKPKLVFFFDEAHLLFADASKAFLQQITQTVRLIRSKGVGVFFVTQTPKDVPGDVLAQLGSRVQHALRAHTPDDAKALKATVSTYPSSGYDLADALQSLGTGEAVVTVLGEKGSPTPVAWTRLRAPQGSMDPAPAVTVQAAVLVSELQPKYGEAVDERSAAEMLEERATEAEAARAEEEARISAEKEAAAAAKEAEKAAAAAERKAEREAAAIQRKLEQEEARRERERAAAAKKTADRVGSVVTSGVRTVVNQVLRNLFKR